MARLGRYLGARPLDKIRTALINKVPQFASQVRAHGRIPPTQSSVARGGEMKKENHIVRGNASEHGRWCVIHWGIPLTFRVLFFFPTAQCMYLSSYLPDRRLGRDRIYFSSLQGTQRNEAAACSGHQHPWQPTRFNGTTIFWAVVRREPLKVPRTISTILRGLAPRRLEFVNWHHIGRIPRAQLGWAYGTGGTARWPTRRARTVNDTADRTFSFLVADRGLVVEGTIGHPRILASGLPLATAPKAIGKQNGDCSRLLPFCTLSLTSFHFHKGQSGVDVPCLAEKSFNLPTDQLWIPIHIPCANHCTLVPRAYLRVVVLFLSFTPFVPKYKTF